MKVAWLANVVSGGPALLPGDLAGGGEMADAGMIAHAPEGVEVVRVHPAQWQDALTADRIVITGTEMLTGEALTLLGERSPLLWVHHAQTPSSVLAAFIAKADPFITMSAAHSAREAQWSRRVSVWNHGVVDPDDVAPGDKGDHALWAARNHPQKGRMGARIWAQRQGVPLVEITDAPRAEVLAAMSKARWFVFLPKGFDSCPRTLIEAELAECEIVTNGLAGRRDPGDIREVLNAQPAKFWSLV